MTKPSLQEKHKAKDESKMTHRKFRISVSPEQNIFHRDLPTGSPKLRRTAIECDGTSYVFSGTNVTQNSSV